MAGVGSWCLGVSGMQIHGHPAYWRQSTWRTSTEERQAGVGAQSVPLRFADADWHAGDYVYADLNGVIIAGRQLH